MLLSARGAAKGRRHSSFPGTQLITHFNSSTRPEFQGLRLTPLPLEPAPSFSQRRAERHLRLNQQLHLCPPVLLVGDALSNLAGKLLADRLLDSPRYSRVMELCTLWGHEGSAQSRFVLQIHCFQGSVSTILQDASNKSSHRLAVSRIFDSVRFTLLRSLPAHPERVFLHNCKPSCPVMLMHGHEGC